MLILQILNNRITCSVKSWKIWKYLEKLGNFVTLLAMPTFSWNIIDKFFFIYLCLILSPRWELGGFTKCQIRISTRLITKKKQIIRIKMNCYLSEEISRTEEMSSIWSVSFSSFSCHFRNSHTCTTLSLQ